MRGHWRHFWLDKENAIVDMSKIGKDRQDDYCVKGRTWVTESIKGVETLDMLNKVRIVNR